jgi:hypothetical protein
VTRALDKDDVSDMPSGYTELAAPTTPAQEDEVALAPIPSAPIPAAQLTAVERLAVALRQLTGHAPTTGAKVETWHRISVTADVEISVRGFGHDQLVVFREVADLLRHLLVRTDLPSHEEEE